MKGLRKHFTSSIVVSIIGLILGAWVGYLYSPTIEGALTALFLTFILCVLEVSLSFDNAVVNAAVLEDMSAIWRQRFITWGIPIAVFGMRILFPLVIVAVIAQISPYDALMMATFDPDQYAKIMLSSHLALAGYGGAFLLMVAFTYFIDHEKETHWLGWIEKPLVKMGRVEAISLALCLLLFYIMSLFLHSTEERLAFVEAGVFGMITFVAVDGLSTVLKMSPGGTKALKRSGGFAMFIYLQVLDASFSFDGVIGAFALTHNLYLIAIGLGIGAMFVRSMTLYLVEKGTLNQFIYLEHGAFYAIAALAILMLMDVYLHIPEAVTGLVGATMIGLSIISSVRHDRSRSRRRA